jgi:hypothetical protein
MADSFTHASPSAPSQKDYLPPGSWPPPLAHCGDPLAQATDEWVTVCEVTSEPANGYKGNRFLYTALVPSNELSAVLAVYTTTSALAVSSASSGRTASIHLNSGSMELTEKGMRA